MIIGIDALTVLVKGVYLVAPAVFLDAADFPALLLDQHFFEILLRLPTRFGAGVAGGETGGVSAECGC